MLISSFDRGSINYFTSMIQLNRQVTIRGVHSLFRSYISSLIKPFKHNTIQGIHLLHQCYYSSLIKPLKHNTIQDVCLIHRSHYSNIISHLSIVRFKKFVYYIEVTIQVKISGMYQLSILESILNTHNSFRTKFSGMN